MARLKSKPKPNPYDAFSDEELEAKARACEAAYQAGVLSAYPSRSFDVDAPGEARAVSGEDAEEAHLRAVKAYEEGFDILTELRRRREMSPMSVLMEKMK